MPTNYQRVAKRVALWLIYLITYKKSMTTFLTIVSGILIFLAGQYFVKFLIEPVMDLRKHIGRIGYLLIFHANKMYSTDENTNELRSEIRKSASKLIELTHIPLWYNFTRVIFAMPTEEDIYKAIPNLIGLSNTIGEQTIETPKYEKIQTIKELLKIKGF